LIKVDTKLTLKLNQEVIEKAKAYASERQQSLSRIIENYLKSLTSEKGVEQTEISPFVKSLSSGTTLPTDVDLKEYQQQKLEKHA